MFRSIVTIAALLLFFFVTTSSAFDRSSLNNPSIRKDAITNLLIGLQSDNFGLRTSSAFMLGEVKAEEAVLPLMRMLRTEESEDARIVAALALYKIDNPKGIFAVSQAKRFDNSERVRKMCANFYNETLKIKYGINESYSDSSEVAIR